MSDREDTRASIEPLDNSRPTGGESNNSQPCKRRRRDDEQNSSFFRREDTPTDDISSVYNNEKKEVPAWMKNDKYDKYGSRSPVVSTPLRARYTNTLDERYSKYMNNSSTTTERIKRKDREREYEDEESHECRNNDSKGDDIEAAPYNQVAVNSAAHTNYETFKSYLSHKHNKDLNSIVKTHYNQRTYQSKVQGSRSKSPIIKLRNFNNIIKYMLLGDWVRRDGEGDSPVVILDICCGKGGDLNKCEFVSVDQYIGVDISDASIREAFSRYSRNKARFIPQHSQSIKHRDTRRYNFEAYFATGDCFGKTIPDILEPNFPGIIDNLFPVDCVSVQFSLHYAFENEEKINILLTNVSKSLRQGGTFVGTVPSSDFFREKITSRDYVTNGDFKFGNELYSVTFHEEPPADGVFRPPFGHKYEYYLKDAIDNVPEYVVPFESFRALCEEYGMILKLKKNFVDVFNQNILRYFNKLNRNLLEGIRRTDGKYGVEGAEKEVAAFYIAFAFEKQ